MPNTAPTNQMPRTSELENESRQRCYQCFRPMSLCFCDAIPRIDNRTDVLILQHVGERFHPFNTARIVRRALRRCQLIADHNQRLALRKLPIHTNAALLYPGADAPSLSELPANERPSQLVIVDGTWHQAKTIVRDVPQLHRLPCFRLEPAAIGQYRIRREPNAESLSTVEAAVAALQTLEPDTIGLDQLLSAFYQMVEDQLAHAGSHAAWRQNRKRQSRPRHFPRALLGDPDNLVVAYGEATPGQIGQRPTNSLPISWVAQRLGATERFACLLRQQQPLSKTALQHMRLSTADFKAAVSPEEFRTRWSNFLGRHDALIVYHQRTIQLLQHVGAAQPSCLVLKSIFGKWRTGFHSVEELIAAEGVSSLTSEANNRAHHRLDMAVALVEHLRNCYRQTT